MAETSGVKIEYIDPHFGNIRYGYDSESSEKIGTYGVDWVLRDPSPYDIEKYQPHAIVRVYHQTPYLVSNSLAKKLIDPINIIENHPTGAAIILYFKYRGQKYYIFVADNKPYWQLVQGGIDVVDNNRESPIDCAIREIHEEIGIRLFPDNLRQIGYYQIDSSCPVVDFKYTIHTSIFIAEIDISKIGHLFSMEAIDSINQSGNMYQIYYPKGNLNEIDMVMIVPESNMINVPEEICGKTFRNHHRELALRSLGMSAYSTLHLKSLVVDF
jgi:8-oxo-dGTP pyrophosphatase MutT (NUDIX family)